MNPHSLLLNRGEVFCIPTLCASEKHLQRGVSMIAVGGPIFTCVVGTQSCLVALVVAYDYHPLATTLFDTFLIPMATPTYQSRGMMPEPIEPIPEPTIWSFMIQISNAMKAVHDRGLAFRVIDATKILLSGTSRSERD
jgi:hypothetical protein